MSMSQQSRTAVLDTELGENVLNAVRFEGTEGLSQDFEYRVEAVGEKTLADLDKLVGTSATLTVLNKADVPRHFNGIVAGASWLGEENEAYLYEITLRPKFWLATKSSDFRMFHEKTAKDIVEGVLGEWQIEKDSRLTENYRKREYCVQYGESDHDFLCRLMEQEGMYYYFEHGSGSHKMILADAKSSHKSIPNLSTVRFQPWTQNVPVPEDRLFTLNIVRQLRSGRVALGDYNHLLPTANMLATSTAKGRYAEADHERFEYPGDYAEPGDKERIAKVRVEEEQTLDERRQATGDTPLVFPGGLVTVEQHPEGKQNIEYLVVSARHSFQDQSYRSGGRERAGGTLYRGTYEFTPSDRPFRAPRVTPRPRVYGPQTAKVAGKGEIDVDKHGRILLTFFWDREKGESRRVRVAQIWSGKQWGGIVIPRVGQEVVVEFLHGDPDRPLVVGTVYNEQYKVPYKLPDEKTKAGVKSESTENGVGQYNEFVFDDMKGSELIGLHAQKDLDVVVLNSETRTIAEKLQGSKARTTVLKKGDDDLTLDQGNQNITLKVGSQKTDVKQNVTIEAGMNVTIEAGVKMTLKVGSTKIELTPAGVTIKAPGMADIDGGGIMKLKAGLININ